MTSQERVCWSAFQAAVHANTRCIRNVAHWKSIQIIVENKIIDLTQCLTTGTYGTVKQYQQY